MSALPIPEGFFRDAVNPTNDEIRRWAAVADANYPPEMEQDWDLVVVDYSRTERRELLLELAADPACPNHTFFLRCLYLMVGDAVRTHGGLWPFSEVAAWLDSIPASSPPPIKLFVLRSRELLQNPALFDYDKWCAGGYARGET